MKNGTLIDKLSKFDPEKIITLMVPAHAKDIPVEIVEVLDGAFLPEDGLVAREDIIVIRATR